MKFEELYEKYLDGTATEEEREYVEGEIEKARKLNDILDRQDARRVIEPVEEDEVKKAQKAFNFKALIRTVVVVTVVFLLMAGGVLGGVFGTAAVSAKEAIKISREEASEIAKNHVVNNLGVTVEVRVVEINSDIQVEFNLKKSYYEYDVDLVDANGFEYELIVNSIDGSVVVDDIDRDND